MRKLDLENYGTPFGLFTRELCSSARLSNFDTRVNCHDRWRTRSTHGGLGGCSRKGQFEDVSSDGPSNENDSDDDHEQVGIDSSPVWEHEERQVKRKLEMQPSSSSSLACPRGETLMAEGTVSSQEQRVRENLEDTFGTPKNHTQFSGAWMCARYGLVIALKLVYERMIEMGLQQCKTDPCVWKLVKETSWRPPSQVLALFHIEWLHTKWKWSEWERGHLRMRGIDVSQLEGRCFLMDAKAYVAAIKPERRKMPEKSPTNQETSLLKGLGRAMQWFCTQTDAKRAFVESMLQSSLPTVTVGTLMKSNRVLKEMKADLVELRVSQGAVGCGDLV